MRCLSPHSKYSIQVIEADEQIVVDQRGTARSIVRSKPVIAEFDTGGLMDHEIEVALESFQFSGLPEGVNPLTRISVFDTEAYVQRFDESEQAAWLEKIDARLRKLQGYHPNEFVIVDQPAASKPWPSYDEDSVEEIVKFQARLGIPAETVRLYELEHEHRDEIIEAMLRAEDPSEAERLYGPAEESAEEIVVGA